MNEPARGAVASRYAARLLRDVGAAGLQPGPVPDESPDEAFERSGLLALTGPAEGPPVACPIAVASCADGALAALSALAPPGACHGLRGADLLAERASIMGLSRQGAIAPGGACRLVEAADGAVAVNFARDDDWELVPAWLEVDGIREWSALAVEIARRGVDHLVERARLLGLAVAADRAPGAGASWFRLHAADGWGRSRVLIPGQRVGRSRSPTQGRRSGGRSRTPTPDRGTTPAPDRRAEPSQRFRVVDLSSLWAGPLCSRLLRLAGADVVKVESMQRPDGGRRGSPAFFERLNAGKAERSVDLASRAGIDELHGLIETADVVIEASRPRALRQLGIDAERLVATREGLTWISITGYGRELPEGQWIAYGDDAGVAGGLSDAMVRATGRRLFVGDAIADPLTGLHAAVAALASVRSGGSRLVGVAMRDVVAHVVQHGPR